MDINYGAVFVCAILSMVIGFLWYGPLFGKKWMEVNELSPDDLAKREAMQKSAGLLYAVQFCLSLLQLFVLTLFLHAYYRYVNLLGSCVEMGQCLDKTNVYLHSSFLIWLGFVMPTVAGLSMWNAKPVRVRWMLFGLSAGYQLVSFLVFGLILSIWK